MLANPDVLSANIEYLEYTEQSAELHLALNIVYVFHQMAALELVKL